jgi:VanZ family protein
MAHTKFFNLQVLAALPFMAASAAIFIASSMPMLRPPDIGFDWQDKLFHAIAYAVYAACVHLFVVHTLRLRTPAQIWGTVIAIGLLFAASDEWHQTFVEGRVGDVADWLADAAGVLVYVIGVLCLRGYMPSA